MRIIADNRDYYDCIQTYGQDQSLVYFRKPKEVHLKRGQWPWARSSRGQWTFAVIDAWWFWDYEITQYIIGFCGKIYPMLKLFNCSDKSRKCFNMDEVDAFVEENLKSGEKKAYRGQAPWWSCRSVRRSQFVRFFDDCKRQQDSYSNYFLEKLCPIFVARYSRWQESMITYNALLRPYDFVKVFDPYAAFQEIAMFLGNMAMPEKVMPIISDELKLRSKGFSDQSFRSPFKDSRRIPK